MPITSYFRVFARLWLNISTYLIRKLYISPYAPRITQGTCVKSVHKAIGSPKDPISHCSIHSAFDLLSTPSETFIFSNIATKQCTICSEVEKNQALANRVENGLKLN